MSKRLIGVMCALACLATIFTPMAVRAAPALDQVTIGGRVMDNGSPMAHYQIAIDCKGALWANFVAVAQTTSEGYYETQTTTTTCPLGSTVEVRIDVNADGKFELGAHGIVYANTTVNFFLDLNNTDVPELGLLGSVAATGAGLTLLVLFHRRSSRIARDRAS